MMSEEQAQNVSQMMSDQLQMIESLYQIALSSEDAETVRIAISALTNTQSGMAYLQTNPIIL